MSVPLAHEVPLLTIPQAAAVLGISKSAAWEAVAAGTLPVVRINARPKVVTAELRRLLGLPVETENTVDPATPEPTRT